MGLTKENLLKNISYISLDPNNSDKVDALNAGRNRDALDKETTKKISANLH